MIEQKNNFSELDDIEEMKTFRPTESEFRDPISYIERLMYLEDAAKYGCIKIIPPNSFKPPLAFDMASN